MDKNKNYSNLKKFCLELGVDLFGVADIRQIKKEFAISEEILANFDKAVCLGLGLSKATLAEIEGFPTRLYFHHYRTVNFFLDQAALRLNNYLQRKNYPALAIPASQIVDWQKQTAHAPHKKIGHLAGLGWIGRNNLLVNKHLGSQFRLVSVLTNMPLKVDEPVSFGCGSCRLCIRSCPVGAIKEDPCGFEYLKCFEKLREFQKERLVDQYICGICVKTCK